MITKEQLEQLLQAHSEAHSSDDYFGLDTAAVASVLIVRAADIIKKKSSSLKQLAAPLLAQGLTAPVSRRYSAPIAEKNAIGFSSSCNRVANGYAPQRFVAFSFFAPSMAAWMGGLTACRFAHAVPGLLTRSSCRPHLAVGAAVLQSNRMESPMSAQDHRISESQNNPLNAAFERFNTQIYQRHSSALASSARALNQAYQTAYSIECIMLMLIADDAERGRPANGQPLSPYLRGGLSAGIAQMAASLHSDLCNEADRLDLMLERAA